MRWVKLTLPPRERARWLLMTTRLSMSSLAGTARTLVAVGTVSEASMLFTTRDGAPRSGTTASSLTGPVPLTAGMSRGFGASAPASGFGAVFGSAFAAGALASGALASGALVSGALVSGALAAGAFAGAEAFTEAPLAEPFGEPLAAPLSVGAGVASGLLAVVWVLLA